MIQYNGVIPGMIVRDFTRLLGVFLCRKKAFFGVVGMMKGHDG
jgi:hypothetical protein